MLFTGCHIHTVDDFLNLGTLQSPELEQLTLPESTEGGSPDKIYTFTKSTQLELERPLNLGF